MNTKIVIALLVAVFCAVAESRILHRVRRQQQPSASNLKRDSLGPIIYADDKADPGYAAPHKGGKVGPVFTFVKTDPYANFKWGVRHVAGVKYGRK